MAVSTAQKSVAKGRRLSSVASYNQMYNMSVKQFNSISKVTDMPITSTIGNGKNGQTMYTLECSKRRMGRVRQVIIDT